MAKPLQGTFEYVAVVPDRAGTVFSCQARLQRQLGDLEHNSRLLGPSPLLQVEDAGPTPNPSASNPATDRSRLRLIAADRRHASIAEASFILDRGIISALHPGDLLHMVRTSCGRIGISAIRSNQLIFAAGAITQVPLGCNFEALIRTDLVSEDKSVLQRRETGFRPRRGLRRLLWRWQGPLLQYPVEVRASGEQHLIIRGGIELGSFKVWVLHGFYCGMPGINECLSVAQKGACPVVDANTSALFLDSDHLEMVHWPSQYDGAPMTRPLSSSSNTSLADTDPIADVSESSLFSFVDLKDPFSPSEIAGEDLPGPILSLIGARKFDFLFLFHTPHTRNNALETEREILLRCPDCRVSLHQLPVSDPKDYSFVMARLTREVRELVNQVRTRNNYVCVSSGTAEMRAAWFLLTALHVLPAKLLQVDAPLFGPVNVKEIVDTRDWQTVRKVLMPSFYEQMKPLVIDPKDLHSQESGDGSKPIIIGSEPQMAAARPRKRRLLEYLTPGAKRDPNIDSSPRYKVSRIAVPSDELSLNEADSNAAEDHEEHIVPGLDAALQELGIHIGSATLRYAAEQAGIAAGSFLPVLLLGETGTGKERFAHLIHRLSPRSSHEMVAINCAAIPKELAESYLFGHTKGAFTGAVSDKHGVFEDADRSTLFLDEVAELPLEIQSKLLRVIQDGTFHRVGSTKLLRVDVRIVAATNRDLAKEVDAGRFREDLYFRLEVVQIKLPSLRERRAEIPELALFILRQINQRRLKPRQLSKEALARLEHYRWPGNVRELHNVLERSVLYSPRESLEAEHLKIKADEKSVINLFDLPEPFEGFSLEEYLDGVREQLIRRALESSGGNQAEAGRLLGMSRQAINKFLAERSDNPS